MPVLITGGTGFIGGNPSAAELVDMVRARVPEAQINFQPNQSMRPLLNRMKMRFDDSRAREEWGWEPYYTQEHMVDDFLQEMKEYPQRYG